MKAPCPRCGIDTDLAASNPDRPFCSARCRNVDLHAWTSDQYRISSDAPATDEDGLFRPSDQPSGGPHN